MSATIGRVAHQPTDFDNLTTGIARKLDAPGDEEDVGGHKQGVGAVVHEGVKGRLDLASGAGAEDLSLQSDGAGRFRYVS